MTNTSSPAPGYVEIDGGGTFFSDPNRKQDPYLEVTIIAVVGQAFEQCRELLAKPSFEQNGTDYRHRKVHLKAGNQREENGIVRMDSLSDCRLEPRR